MCWTAQAIGVAQACLQALDIQLLLVLLLMQLVLHLLFLHLWCDHTQGWERYDNKCETEKKLAAIFWGAQPFCDHISTQVPPTHHNTNCNNERKAQASHNISQKETWYVHVLCRVLWYGECVMLIRVMLALV